MAIFSRKKVPILNKGNGRFIVIDGPDGTGKKTQTNLLAQTLAVSGYDGVMFDFPQYGQVSSAMLEKYLNGDYGVLNPEAASIFYAIDRFDASFKMREMIDEGKIILSNRYVTSNAGYQGAKIPEYEDRIKFYKWLDNLEYGTYNSPKADLNIILHIPADMTISENRKNDIHNQDPELMRRTEEVYLEIAELFPNTRLVECTDNGRLLSPAEIHGKVWELVRRIVLKDVEPTINVV